MGLCKVLTLVEGEAICRATESGVSESGAVLLRPDGYVGFLAENWTPDAIGALDKLLGSFFTPAAGS